VDPDNRRPVDFEKRKRFLREIKNKASSDPLGLIEELLANREDGRIKVFLIARALQARNANAALFQHGSYVPLTVSGEFKAHVMAFARIYKNRCAITVVPRYLAGLVKENQNPHGTRVWRDTEIIFTEKNGIGWKNIFTGQTLTENASLKIGNILMHFPCALLLGKGIQ
jgi:(1->4)-alpha-D-glucan 1-alpha-D-glucosylmutase